MSESEDVLKFWFGSLDSEGRADAEHAQRWWKKDDEFDSAIRQFFGVVHEALAHGQREEWLGSARGTLAYVIVLDQFSRNMFRGSGRMFERDPQALRASLVGIDRGFDRELALDERGFLYMPLMHSEDIAMQDRCVALFSAFRDEVSGDAKKSIANSVDFAIRHRDIVQRFGRFPHRNGLLGRTSKGEEIEFLLEPGSSF